MRKHVAQSFLGLMIAASLVAFFSLSSNAQLDQVLQDPGWRHWMGTDNLGRDLMVRVLKGNFYSWLIGGLAAILAFAIGCSFGFVAGSRRGWVDFLLMRGLEILDSIPSVVLVTMAVLFTGAWVGDGSRGRLISLAIGIALTHWMSFARLSRALVLQEMNSSYIEGAVAIGAGSARIFWHHLRPQLWPVLLQSLWTQLPTFLLFESLLSFLGFGLQPPDTSLGSLLQEGWKTFSLAPHLLLAPGLLLFLTLLSFQSVTVEK